MITLLLIISFLFNFVLLLFICQISEGYNKLHHEINMLKIGVKNIEFTIKLIEEVINERED